MNFLTLDAYKYVTFPEIKFEGNENTKYKSYFWENSLEKQSPKETDKDYIRALARVVSQ